MDSILVAYGPPSKMSYEGLAKVPTPPGTDTHRPVPHHHLVDTLIETLSFRQISVHQQEYAVSDDGMKMFGLMELSTTFDGCRFAIGIRNSHDKSMRLAMTVGYRVLVCSNMAFNGDFQPVLAKHSKHFDLRNAISTGVDQMQRNFDPMVKAVESWRGSRISDDTARRVIYDAFIEGRLAVPHYIVQKVHDAYFHAHLAEFQPRSMWSLSNAFTGAFKFLDPIPAFKATAKLAEFLKPYEPGA